jgi:SAM-dependent methyltransferase
LGDPLGRSPNRAQYSLAAPAGLPARLAAYQRAKMFRAYLDFSGAGAADTVLDIGATADRSYAHSNYFEAWYPHKMKVTAVGVDDAAFLQSTYPGLRFLRVDGRALPFRDSSFDYVHSSAVLEHVGCREYQLRFIREAWRVCRKGIFITTPNRWFPVEFHTLLPLLHWLPPGWFRAVLVRTGHDFFASEENLNLLSKRRLSLIAAAVGINDRRTTAVRLFGWPTNLILSATKQAR